MEWLNQLLSEKYLFALGWVLIHALWQIAGIGILLWALLKIQHSKTAAYKYKLSMFALLMIPLLAMLTFSYELAYQQDAFIASGSTEVEQSQLMFLLQSDEQSPLSADWKTKLQPYIPQLVNLWFVGAILFLIRLAAGLSDINQLRRKNHTALSDEFQNFLTEKAIQLDIKRPVSLLHSIHVDMPITFGTWKPIILIPTSLLLQISPAQLEAIISHELAHIKRHDYIFNMIQRYLEVLYFFHPVFWWINNEIRKFREMACDEMALHHGTEPKALAYGLANVLNHAKNSSPELALAAARKDHPTLMRIKRIMGIQSEYSQPTILTSITMILTLLIGATLMVSAEKETPAQPEEIQPQISLSDTTKNEKTIITDEGIIFRLDKNTNLTIIDTTRIKGSKKLYLDSLFAEKHQLTPEELERIQKSFKSEGDWFIPFKDLDFEAEFFSNMPRLKLEDLPKLELGEMPHFDFDEEAFEKMLPGPDFYDKMPRIVIPRDSAMRFYRMPTWPFEGDTTKMDREQLEQFKKEVREKTAALRLAIQAQNEERKAKIEEWKSEHQEELAEWREKQQEWREKQQEWREQNLAQVRVWKDQNQPMLEKYKIEIKKWEEENGPQLEAYKKEMEAWRKNYETEMLELKKQLKEMQMKLKEQSENQ
ncbi:TonB family protein [Indibacter alkaliphilus LW1]|uniref:TonB family protein n=1 Tax=Indibacter alkaliphilus (strain CCUG 57479 / KCTC 22604 / LW1) TaxID=1189612 RepID=S2CZ22_INDAL|nr:M56 family metallopeptidase [Indibacter alkaliphilus]EOZ92402.1 TonB family protein [Indibacter alkaliphilus LW1]